MALIIPKIQKQIQILKLFAIIGKIYALKTVNQKSLYNNAKENQFIKTAKPIPLGGRISAIYT